MNPEQRKQAAKRIQESQHEISEYARIENYNLNPAQQRCEELLTLLADAEKEIEEMQAILTEAKRLQNIEYRHECLRSMYADEMNYLDDDSTVDLAIDKFILENES